MSSNCITPSDEDGWITGAALETVIALNGIQVGDWIRHAPNCVQISIPHEWIGKADRIEYFKAERDYPGRWDFKTEAGGWHTSTGFIDAWKPGERKKP